MSSLRDTPIANQIEVRQYGAGPLVDGPMVIAAGSSPRTKRLKAGSISRR
jgi:hypothetical protein